MMTGRMDRLLAACLAAASLLYAALSPRFHVGAYNDDSLYVLAAQSLLQGSYAQLNLPNHPPFTLYPPGFPLLLAPFMKLVGTGSLLKIVPMILTLLSLFLLWKLTEGWFSRERQLLLVGMCALNPLTAAFSGLLMSESFFVTAVLGIFLWMRLRPTEWSRKEAWIFGLLLGWTALIRTDGMVILPAVALGLAWKRRWRTMAISLSVAVVACGLFYIRNLWVSGSSTLIYQEGWGLMFQEGARQGPGFFIRNVRDVVFTLVLQNLFSPQMALEALPGFLTGSLAVGLGVLAFLGLRTFFHEQPKQAPVLIAIASFCVLYLGIHLPWIWVEARYNIPLIPFLLAALFKGAERCIVRFPRARIGFAAVAGLTLMGYIAQNVLAAHAAWFSKSPSFPVETYRWISDSTPQDALFLASGPAAITLYAGRFSTVEAPARDSEHFRYQLLDRGVRYVLLNKRVYYPIPIPGQDPNRFWALRRSWMMRQPNAYRSLYKNEEEGTELFEVSDNRGFRTAYKLHLAALDAFDQSEWDSGFSLLDRALQSDSNLISAYNAYGVGSLLSGKKTDAALRKLRQAHRLATDNALVLLNLARLEQRAGEAVAAKHFEMARSAAEKTGEYSSLFR